MRSLSFPEPATMDPPCKLGGWGRHLGQRWEGGGVGGRSGTEEWVNSGRRCGDIQCGWSRGHWEREWEVRAERLRLGVGIPPWLHRLGGPCSQGRVG